ncbi:hypothetical protein GGG16DRAFT_127897 [Schizophyllum commune]
MSPRSSSTSPATSRSASAPYPAPRRPSGQPKSSRQQFSACGACRMRRVRCDLKDLPSVNGSPPACSNCKERGLKCVDEFADVKAVKLLRRGRRLQQVEAIYGKVDNNAGPALGASAHRQVTIPSLQPEFFTSQFWKLFHMQRPVLDPTELAARVSAHVKGNNSLGAPGEILTLVLVVWAASFGVDERGVCEPSSVDEDPNRARTRSASTTTSAHGHKACDASTKRQGRKDRTIAMLRELLELVDMHGLLRKPSWDGCRALLLITPLLEDFIPLERNNFTEVALMQARALCCSHAASSPQSPDQTITRLRILSYAIIQDAFTNGLSGNRLVFDEIDIDTINRLSIAIGHSYSPYSPSFPSSPMGMHSPTSGQSGNGYLFMMPLHLAAVCWKINAALTSVSAMRRIEDGQGIDAQGMREIWDGLDRCWEDFDGIRLSTAASEESVFDLQRFVGAWQVAIFECHNIVRESLKQVLNTGASTPHKPVPHIAYQLQDVATRRCLELLPKTLSIIKMHASHSGNHMDSSGLFRWDTGIVRDGCFFAGVLAASVKKDGADDFKLEACRLSPADLEEGVALTISALSEMNWALSKSDDREQTIRLIWQTKSSMQFSTGDGQMHYRVEAPFSSSPVFAPDAESSRPGSQGMLTVPAHVHGRPQPPPLTLPDGPIRGIASAPTTAVSADGSVWSSYSPPGTATSGTNSTSTTGVSGGGSPMFASPVSTMPVFKSDMEDPGAFFQGSSGDLDTFGVMSVDNPASGVVAAAPFDHRSSGYMDTGVGVFTPGNMGPSPGPPDVNSFQDDHGFYHH